MSWFGRKRVPGRAARAATVLTTLAIGCLLVVQAYAVIVAAGPTTTLSDDTTGAESTYTFGTYATRNERASGFSITFPAGFDVSGAEAISPAGTIEVSGQTVNVTFDTPVPRRTDFSLSLGGIVNPSAPDTYDLGPITVYRLHQVQNWVLDPPHDVATAPVTIVAPYLNLSISTNLLEFELQPDTVSPPQYVVLHVESSHDYTITREITGDADLFGLTVEGEAEGTKTAGIGEHTDTYTAEVTWTAEGGATYTATVVYSVVQ